MNKYLMVIAARADKVPYSRNLLREKTFVIWRKQDFHRENFRGLLAGVAAKRCHAPQFHEENFHG